MLVLLGETRSFRNIEILKQMRWGRMFVVANPTPYPFEPWGFDNGAFVAWKNARPCPAEEFERRLDVALRCQYDPVLAVTPDIVAGGLHSLEFSCNWRMKLPSSWPWYLAVQDGMTSRDVADVMHLFSGVFLGGSDKFKNTAQMWSDLAHSLQKKFHYGRAGTIPKLRHAYRVEADSCDSAFPLWTKERMNLFIKKFTGLDDQLCLHGQNLSVGQSKLVV